MTLKENPKSYGQLAVSAIRNRLWVLWAASFLFFTVATALGVMTIIHVEVMEVGVLAQAEAQTGEELAERVHLPGVGVSLVLYFLAAVASLHSLVTVRTE